MWSPGQGLLHLGLVAQALLVLLHLLLRDLLGDLRLELVQAGQLRLTHVVHADHVPAELALHRGLGELAFFQLDHGLRELGHVAGCGRPVQVTAVGAGARVLGLLLGDVLELGALLEVGDDGLGLVFLLDQDVARLVFLARAGGGELVVLGLDLGVGHGVLLLVVREEGADHDGLAGQLHLVLELGAVGHALLLRFLHEDLAQHDFFLDLGTDGVVDRTAAGLDLLHQGIHARGGHGFAVDDGHVLRGRPGGGGHQDRRGQCREGDFHGWKSSKLERCWSRRAHAGSRGDVTEGSRGLRQRWISMARACSPASVN